MFNYQVTSRGTWVLLPLPPGIYISLKMKHGLVRPGRQRWERRSEAGELARSQARCLIDRVGTFGPGAAAATMLRQWALQEEATMSKERNAHQLCLAQGRYALRRGQFHLWFTLKIFFNVNQTWLFCHLPRNKCFKTQIASECSDNSMHSQPILNFPLGLN